MATKFQAYLPSDLFWDSIDSNRQEKKDEHGERSECMPPTVLEGAFFALSSKTKEEVAAVVLEMWNGNTFLRSVPRHLKVTAPALGEPLSSCLKLTELYIKKECTKEMAKEVMSIFKKHPLPWPPEYQTCVLSILQWSLPHAKPFRQLPQFVKELENHASTTSDPALWRRYCTTCLRLAECPGYEKQALGLIRIASHFLDRARASATAHFPDLQRYIGALYATHASAQLFHTIRAFFGGSCDFHDVAEDQLDSGLDHAFSILDEDTLPLLKNVAWRYGFDKRQDWEPISTLEKQYLAILSNRKRGDPDWPRFLDELRCFGSSFDTKSAEHRGHECDASFYHKSCLHRLCLILEAFPLAPFLKTHLSAHGNSAAAAALGQLLSELKNMPPLLAHHLRQLQSTLAEVECQRQVIMPVAADALFSQEIQAWAKFTPEST